MDHIAERLTPRQALERLKAGNERFARGQQLQQGRDLARLQEAAAHGQRPYATVVCCSDSRCPPEIIFDAGIGELFVVRVAGNVCGINEIASVEYGMKALGTPVCVVLGHTGCGAVGAVTGNERLSSNMLRLCRQIQQAVSRPETEKQAAGDPGDTTWVVRENVWLSVEELLRGSGEIRRLLFDSSTQLVGAVLDMTTGQVDWLGTHPRQQQLI
jgi:carbonic anhydrase